MRRAGISRVSRGRARCRRRDAACAARRVKVALHGGVARWTGDVPLANAAAAWDAAGPPVEITVAATPAELGPLVYAVGRLALHARACTLRADVARWEPFLEAISVSSRNAEELEMPTLLAVGDSSDLHPEVHAPEEMARHLNGALDRRCLAAVDEHLTGLLERGADPGHVAGLSPAPDVAAAMFARWRDWRAAFDADPGLLARFLRMLACAQDGESAVDEARTLVGPCKRKLLIRATTAALAVAVGWAGIAPHGREPGNVARVVGANDGDPGAAAFLTGHVCAAERIEGRETAVEAAAFCGEPTSSCCRW